MTAKRNISDLAAAQQRGENASITLRQLEPRVTQLQNKFYKDLVNNTVIGGEVDKATVYKMVALEELVQELIAEGRRGAVAGKKLHKQLSENAGGSNE